MPDLGPAEIFIVLVVALLVFGGSRLAELGGSLGKGIKEFRKEISSPEPVEPFLGTLPPAPTPEPATAPNLICTNCNSRNAPDARFCSECGAGLTASQRT